MVTKIKIAAGTLIATAILTLGAATAVDTSVYPESMHIDSASLTRYEQRVEFDTEKRSIDSAAASCFVGGAWDIDSLLALNKQYYSLVVGEGSDTHNRIVGSIIPLMPEVKKIAEEHGIDPYWMGGTIARESLGCKFAVYRSIRPGRHPVVKELSMGFMQVNILANKLDTETVKDIFYPETNLNLGADILRKCLERYGSEEMASRAYNMGPSAKNSPRLARNTPYVRDVMMFAGMLRRADSTDSGDSGK